MQIGVLDNEMFVNLLCWSTLHRQLKWKIIYLYMLSLVKIVFEEFYGVILKFIRI